MAVIALLIIRCQPISTNFQQNTSAQNPSTNNQKSAETDKNFNDRFTWNMEYKPDTINYLKVTPTFTYAATRSKDNEENNFNYHKQPDQNNSIYNTNSIGTSNAPTYGVTALFNHRFHRKGRNLSINVNISSAPSTQYQHVVNIYS